MRDKLSPCTSEQETLKHLSAAFGAFSAAPKPECRDVAHDASHTTPRPLTFLDATLGASDSLNCAPRRQHQSHSGRIRPGTNRVHQAPPLCARQRGTSQRPQIPAAEKRRTDPA